MNEIFVFTRNSIREKSNNYYKKIIMESLGKYERKMIFERKNIQICKLSVEKISKESIKNNELKLRFKIKNKIFSILGQNFIENNKKKCKIIANNKRNELNNKLNVKKILYRNNFRIKIEFLDYLNNLSYMFYNCSLLLSIEGKFKVKNIKNISHIFQNCSSLISIHDISEINSTNLTDMSNIFDGCCSLQSLPNISKWDTNNVITISELFANCSSLTSLPNISKWKTNNLIDIESLFYGYSALIKLPDISI